MTNWLESRKDRKKENGASEANDELGDSES